VGTAALGCPGERSSPCVVPDDGATGCLQGLSAEGILVRAALMVQRYLQRIVTAALIAFLGSALGTVASAQLCENSPRTVGAFGAENTPRPEPEISLNVHAVLPGLKFVNNILETKLAPSGENVVIYSTDEDESNPHPRIAFISRGALVKVLDANEIAPKAGGFWRYLSSCQFEATTDTRALALAFTTGFDGAGSVFAIVMWQSGDYRIVFSPLVGQGRMVLSLGTVEVWESDGSGECVWCPHHYQIAHYKWHHREYVKTKVTKVDKPYDPAIMTSSPLLLGTVTETR
jgi:hypothetical protein